jgi:hypothetical protein
VELPVRSYAGVAPPVRHPGHPAAGPRPGRVRLDRRATFGVVLDTSGSMNAELLGKALGAIASYALARDVPAARVVFCDAAPTTPATWRWRTSRAGVPGGVTHAGLARG